MVLSRCTSFASSRPHGSSRTFTLMTAGSCTSRGTSAKQTLPHFFASPVRGLCLLPQYRMYVSRCGSRVSVPPRARARRRSQAAWCPPRPASAAPAPPGSRGWPSTCWQTPSRAPARSAPPQPAPCAPARGDAAYVRVTEQTWLHSRAEIQKNGPLTPPSRSGHCSEPYEHSRERWPD